MTKPKIIFFDIDGTLVPLKEGIRPRTVEALQKLRQNGIKLCIATGRAPMEVPKFEGVTFDAFLTYNGSYCFTPERDVFKNLIIRHEVNFCPPSFRFTKNFQRGNFNAVLYFDQSISNMTTPKFKLVLFAITTNR